MSLPEVYRLAHTAECRLQMAASAKSRDLRFVVGHLMHYESLRLRIVEIEHDIGRSQRAKEVQFKGTGDLKKKPSTGQLGRRSPPPPPSNGIPGLDEEDELDLSDSASPPAARGHRRSSPMMATTLMRTLMSQSRPKSPTRLRWSRRSRERATSFSRRITILPENVHAMARPTPKASTVCGSYRPARRTNQASRVWWRK
jgi:hypothetical protein